ncbi:MAG: hypothetical protein K2L42_06965 [Clostridia bacterium]|nr:hypothetical protein [Clostridia bacterium]
MNKVQLENLIKRMNTPFEPEIRVSWETESWKAKREAEKLSDISLLPVLEQVIDEHRGESNEEREVRRAARFIYAKILSNNFDENGFLFLLNELFTETDYWTINSILISIWFLDIPQNTNLSPLLNFAENANRGNLQTVLNILSEYKKKGNKDAISAYPELYKKVLGKSVPLKQAVMDILQNHSIKSKADLDKQTDEDGAALYEDLKAGILEEYDITYKKLVSLLNKLVK